MEKKAVRYKRILGDLLSVVILFSFSLYAQNYTSRDTTKTDTTKSDTLHTKKDKLGYNNTGYNNINIRNNNFYTSNENISSQVLEDSSMTGKSKTDTAYKKTDTLGYNNVKSPDYIYAFDGNAGINYYLQNDNPMKDTSKTDTSKSDTLGYAKRKNNDYAFNGNYTYLKDDSVKTDTTKTDTMSYNKLNSSYANNRSVSNFSIYPIRDLTQKLKVNIYLMDAQTPKIKEILREYEARTYHSKGDFEELNEAAMNAQKDIADILTIRQKKEWENAKNEWWASVNKALNLSFISKDKNNLQ